MSEGYVYVLRNPAMPGFIKIGFTEATVEQRLRQLDNTSVPFPFEEYYAAKVPDCRGLERTLHFVFGDKRPRASREFFQINPDLAKAIIELVPIQELAPVVSPEPVNAEALPETATVRGRTERMSFDRLGLPPGTVLTFSKDPVVTCIVSGARTVNFEGEELSASNAALRAINAMGYNWKTVSGSEYWTYQGRKLSALSPGAGAEGEAPGFE